MPESSLKKVLSEQAIRSHLDHILAHEEFLATDKMQDFLRFVVEEALAGRSRQLKGFTIATEVYGRNTDFDAAHDPVVRIQAGRLRRAIERYYLVGGVHDPIRIDIPKGTYVPVFTANPHAAKEAATSTNIADRSAVEAWPTILVLPFQNTSSIPDLDYLCKGLATELCVQLGYYPDLRVIRFREGIYGTNKASTNAQFAFDCSIYSDGSDVKIVAQLIESASGEQLWTEKIKASSDTVNLLAFQEDVARTIAAHVACERGIIVRKLSSESNLRVTDPTTYETILKTYIYDEDPSTDAYIEAFEALQKSIKKDPRCGLIPARLALLYADNIALEYFDLEQTPLEDALHLAQEAVLLEPNNQLTRIALSRIRFLNDEPDAALVEIDAALNLNPNCLQYLDGIGYMLILLGQWERGTMLISKALELNPFYRVYVHYATWLNWLRQHEYRKALKEVELTIGIGGFWEPLARAATLGQMGKDKLARHAVEELLALKPDFRHRGKTLINHFVKFADIADDIAEGLEKAGLKLQ